MMPKVLVLLRSCQQSPEGPEATSRKPLLALLCLLIPFEGCSCECMCKRACLSGFPGHSSSLLGPWGSGSWPLANCITHCAYYCSMPALSKPWQSKAQCYAWHSQGLHALFYVLHLGSGLLWSDRPVAIWMCTVQALHTAQDAVNVCPVSVLQRALCCSHCIMITHALAVVSSHTSTPPSKLLASRVQ